MSKKAYLAILFTIFSCQQKNETSEPRSHLTEFSIGIRNEINKINTQAEAIDSKLEKLYIDHYNKKKFKSLQKYILNKDGTLWAKENEQIKSELWISGIKPINSEVQEIAKMTESIDEDLQKSLTYSDIIIQSYYNDKNSLNRIYPPIGAPTQYEAKMDIPKFNFYYEADLINNPEKKALWVKDAYVDPAGRGWMISCISPVYYNNLLEGVIGIDVTIEKFLKKFHFLEKSNLIIMQSNGTIIYSPEQIGKTLFLPPFSEHNYFSTIKSNTFKPEKFNLANNPSDEVRNFFKTIQTINDENSHEIIINSAKFSFKKIAIKELNWYLIELYEFK